MDYCDHAPSFLWRIQNFSSITKRMSPPLFSLGLMWQLRFSRFMENGAQKDSLILDCLNASDTLSTLEFRVVVRVIYYDGSNSLRIEGKYQLKEKEWLVWTESSTNFKSSHQYHFQRYTFVTFSVTVIPIGSLENLLKNQKSVEDVNPESACMNSLISDFEKLLNNDESSDFILKCGEKSFHVHKAMLSARSSYFAEMFRSNMKEANEGSAKIEDVEPDILELLLRYLYTGKFPQLPMESLKKVYAAADRFDMEPLKLKCYRLFVDNFICSDEDSDKAVKAEPSSENEQNKVLETEKHKTEEDKFLKELFATREWRSFSQVFPYKAQEMCRPYLLQN